MPFRMQTAMAGKRGGAIPAPFGVRFWSKVTWGDRDECWTWTGALNDSGYGVILIDDHRTLMYAHRVTYERYVGMIPDGMTVDHLCNNRLCVNPRHLEVVTQRENIARAVARRTTCRRGHPRIPENVYITKTGGYQCRVCLRLTQSGAA